MTKKKLTTVKEKYKYFIKRYYEIYGSAKEEKNEADLLLERAVFAFMELQDCEEKYSKIDNWDTRITSFLFEIFNEAKDEGLIDSVDNIIKFNDENIDTEEIGLKGKDLWYERYEKDNSNLSVYPVFGFNGESHNSRTVGIKFQLESQMGNEINYTEVDFERLKIIQKSINTLIDKIENCKCIVKVVGHGQDYEFTSDWDFNDYPQHIDSRTDYLQWNKGLREHYQVVNVEKFYNYNNGVQEYGEKWYVEIRGTEINVIGYPCNFKFYTIENITNEPINSDFRTKILQSKLGEKYFVEKVKRKGNIEEWHIKSDGINAKDLEKEYKITIKGYPDTFSFLVYKKFKPFDNEDFEADDDGRIDILLIKMYELNVNSNGHAYEDFVIERVKKVKGGEEWILGS